MNEKVLSDGLSYKAVPMSDTPRTDRFAESLKPISVDQVDLAIVVQICDLMVAWVQYARGLERELQASVPAEWLKDRKPS